MEKENYKQHFEIFDKEKDLVYFDASASTLKPKCVCDVVDFYNRFESVNSGRGLYKLAYDVTEKVDEARRKVAKFIGAQEEEIVFNKNTTEGINTVALTYASQNLKQGDKIMVSEIEHSSNYLPWIMLAKKIGAQIVNCPLDASGRILAKSFEKVMDEKVKFVALNYVSNTFGHISEIGQIIKIAHKNGAKVLVDASQAISHKKIDVKKLDCDFLTFSGYKMFAPTGIGVLFGKKELLEKTEPLFYGGGMVADFDGQTIELKELPSKFEAGTLPIASILGLGEAVDFIGKIGQDNIERKERQLTEYLLTKLSGIKGIEIYSIEPDLPIIIFNITGVHSHDAASLYDQFNVCVRAGNHCALFVNKLIKQIASIRVSLAFYNTFEDIDKFATATQEIVKFFNKKGI